MRAGLASLTVLVLLLAAPELARAGGFEYAAPGTRSLGRGGAFIARSDDPMALGYNPAALAFLPGYQLMINSHLGFLDACVDRSGGYDDTTPSGFNNTRFGVPDPDDPNNFASREFPRTCREGYPGPSPNIVFTGHPFPELGFGIGILAPAGVGNGVWGNADGSVDVDGVNLPSPLRYAIVQQDLLLVHPTIGVGVSPIPELAFGLSFQWGIAVIDFVNFSSASSGPEDPGDDVRTELEATDYFVPAMIASVHVVPIDQLDIVLNARISDGIQADGTLTTTTGWFGTGMNDSLSPFETRLPGTRLTTGQPWTFGLAIRYSDRLEERYRDPERAARVTGRVEDSMQNEIWDLELDVVWQHNAQVTDFVATPPSGAEVGICEGTRNCAADGPSLVAALPRSLPLPHGWTDQVSVRAGADWNIIPGQIAARIGAHYESSGFNARYQIQDFMPGGRVGLHIGMTLRIERFDISVAYAHIFQFDETVSNGNYRLVAATGAEGQCTDTGGQNYDPSRPVTSRDCYPAGFGAIVNNGTYTADFNIVSLDLRYHFE
jgi:hypothetical protein